MFPLLAERLIQDAIEVGEFEDLPGAGKPIPGAGTHDDPLWWARAYMERLRAQEAWKTKEAPQGLE